MNRITRFWSFLVRKVGLLGALVLVTLSVVLVIYLGFTFMGDRKVAVEEAPVTAAARTVSLYTISAADDGTAVRTADGNAFIVRAESGGRVERIAKVGDTVTRGAIVAQVENSAQRAAVLQAQGAYEAALASASASDVGSASAEDAYEEARTQAVNAYKSAFSSADNILRNTVDQVYSSPDTPIVGLRIDGQGRTLELNEERKALETIFDEWRDKVSAASEDDAERLIREASTIVERLSALVVTLTSLTNEDDAVGENSSMNVDELRSDFAAARGELTGILSSLSGARSGLIAAESALEQADIAASNGDVSLADAQVKQALGVLESARAALGKTSVKTPVAGTVTAVSISVGDIITIGSDVVFVASDEAADAETGDTVTVPLTAVKFTPSKAFIFTVADGKVVAHEVQTGSVTTKSITISGADGITDIVLDVRGLKDGDAVVTQ